MRTTYLISRQRKAEVWGRICVPHYEHARDKQIAATALTHGLTLVTRNMSDFAGSGVSYSTRVNTCPERIHGREQQQILDVV